MLLQKPMHSATAISLTVENKQMNKRKKQITKRITTKIRRPPQLNSSVYHPHWSVTQYEQFAVFTDIVCIDTLLHQECCDKARIVFERIWYIIANVAHIDVHIHQ
jgi:hypothetical protein